MAGKSLSEEDQQLLDTDPEALTVPKLKSLLARHGEELPVDAQRKAFYVARVRELQERVRSALRVRLPSSPPALLRRRTARSRSRSRSPSPHIEMSEAPLPATDETAAPSVVVPAPPETPATTTKRKTREPRWTAMKSATKRPRRKKGVDEEQQQQQQREEEEERTPPSPTKRERPATGAADTAAAAAPMAMEEEQPPKKREPKKPAAKEEAEEDGANPFQTPSRRKTLVVARGTDEIVAEPVAEPVPEPLPAVAEPLSATPMAAAAAAVLQQQEEEPPAAVEVPAEPEPPRLKTPLQPSSLPPPQQQQQQREGEPLPPPVSPFTPAHAPPATLQTTPSRMPPVPGKPPRSVTITRGVITASIIALVAILYALFVSQSLLGSLSFAPPPFCNTLEEASPDCVPCPEHGFCKEGNLACDLGWRRSGWKCVEDAAVAEVAADIADAAHSVLARKNWLYSCGEAGSNALSKAALKDEVLKLDDFGNRADEAFDFAVSRLFDGKGIIEDESALFWTRDVRSIWLSWCMLDKIGCAVAGWLWAHIVAIASVLFALAATAGLALVRKRVATDRMVALSMMEQARAVLVDRARRFEERQIPPPPGSIDPYVPIEHLRDTIIAPEAQTDTLLRQWRQAFSRLTADSRVLKGALMSNGVQVEALKWIGPI